MGHRLKIVMGYVTAQVDGAHSRAAGPNTPPIRPATRCGLRGLVDVDAVGERAAVGVAQLRGDDRCWFLLAAIAGAGACRSMWGWASRPTSAAGLAKAWLQANAMDKVFGTHRADRPGRLEPTGPGARRPAIAR